MIATQETFNYSKEPNHARRDDSERIKKHLAGRGWVSVREILQKLHIDRRRSRLARQFANTQIISGNKGYKLMREATIEEIHHSANRRESQGKQMIADSVEMRAAYHRFHPSAEMTISTENEKE